MRISLLALVLIGCSDFSVDDPDGGLVDAALDDTMTTDEDARDVPSDAARDTASDAASDAATLECQEVEFCDPRTLDHDCDGSFDEGCGACAAGYDSCLEGCCPNEETRIAESGAYPSMFVDARGNIFVAHTGPSWTTYLARYDAERSEWSNDEVSLRGGRRPLVHVDASGRIHLLINARRGTAPEEQDSILYQWSDDGGESWENAPQLRSTPSNAGDWAFGSDGAVHVVVHDYLRGRGYLTHAIWRDAEWALDEFLDTPDGYQPRLQLGVGDRPFVLHAGPAMTLSYIDGNTWRHETIDEGLVYGEGRGAYRDHELELDEDGTVRAQFERRSLAGDVTENVIAERAPDGTWSETSGPAGRLGGLQLVEVGRIGVSDGMMIHVRAPDGWRSEALSGRQGESGVAKVVFGSLYIVYTSTVSPGQLMFARLPSP